MDEQEDEANRRKKASLSGTSLVPETEQKNKVTGYLVLTAITCVAGSSFQFGYNLGVVNAPDKIIAAHFSDVENFATWLWPVAVSVYNVGGMFGALCGPHAAKFLGRKKTLMLNNILAILGGLLMLFTKRAHSVPMLITGRVLVGVNAGCNTVVAPMYLSEVAPVKLRGSLGTLNQFGIVCGILISQVLGLSQVMGTPNSWPYLLGLTAFIGFAQLCVLPFCPESPRYLYLVCENEKEAEKVLKTLRGVSDVSAGLEEMKVEKESVTTETRVSIWGLFTSSSLRRPLVISVVLQLSQQLSGINGVFYYSTNLFETVLSHEKSQAATCGIGIISVVMTAIVVKLVEVKGRRTLMLWGLGGMVVCYTLATVAFVLVTKNFHWAKYVSVVLTLIMIVFFQLGPGPIPWFIVAELFSQGPLPAAISVSGMVNWLSGFLIGLIFPSIKNGIHPYTFCPFIVLVALFWVFTKVFVPETKGKTIHEIMAIFERKRNFGSTQEKSGMTEASNVAEITDRE